MSSPGQKREVAAMQWPALMGMLIAHAVVIKERERNHACLTRNLHTVSFVMPSLQNRVQLATPSYKLKKEKREAKCVDSSTPTDGSSLVDPASVSVIGVVGEKLDQKSPMLPPKKKPRKDKASVKAKKSVDSTSTDSKISELDSKWSEGFNRLEALIMSKSFQPTFSSDVRVTPPCSPTANMSKDSEPFFQLTRRPVDSFTTVKRTGPDTHAAVQLSAGKLEPHKDSHGQASTERTGPDVYASNQHQSASKLKSESH